ncbi:hypothetical protein HRJ34_25270 [Rhizorhabdus wittichii]|uniref:Uncharacterized protein n=1 Tax=Rhizorhabdus wittichii TaxID=160791 RepID=A0A975HDQ7_9SPHN|nr:hypothetical protein [Rhizorhabdus wittichii]QTH21582.1 hypothetical protein HRJ34_25270 [Rhizorhabdus wittichii]
MAAPDPAPTLPPAPAMPPAVPSLGAGQIEIWKKIVDVQQHFNDLELRIRNFALIVTGAFLGLGGYAIKDAGVVKLFGLEISIAGLVVVSAIFPLAAFYFMDRLWYHRLLDGSVYAGIEAETALKDLGYKVDLGSKIKEHSPFKLWITKKKMIRSATKMDLFYAILAGSLLLVAGFLGFGIRPQAVGGKTPPPVVAPPIANLPADVASPAFPPNSLAPALPPPQATVAVGPTKVAGPIVGNSQAK